MQTHAAVFRDSQSMKEGCERLDGIYDELQDVKVSPQICVTQKLIVFSSSLKESSTPQVLYIFEKNL